jgi:hypothetical protein
MHLRWPSVVLIGVFFFTAACGNDSGYCPGLCPVDRTFPTMTIEVAGGAATIASSEIVSGPCTRLLVHSAGEAGAPAGYAAAQITYNGPSDIPPLCLVKLTSLYGDTSVVTASVSATSYEQPCCPYGSCCPKASAITQHLRVVFDQPVQTVSFPIPPSPQLDGGVEDTALDAAGTAINADLESGVDSGQVLDLASAF